MSNEELYDRLQLLCIGLGVGCGIGAIIMSLLNPLFVLIVSVGLIGLSYGFYYKYEQEKLNSDNRIFTDEFIDKVSQPWKIKDE